MITPIFQSSDALASITWFAPVDLAVKSVLILAAAGAAMFAMRRASAATRHLVWVLAVVATLTLPLLSGLVPQWRVLPAWIGQYDSPATTIAQTEGKPTVPAVVTAPDDARPPSADIVPALSGGPVDRDIADAGGAITTTPPPARVELPAVTPKPVIAPRHASVWPSVRRWATVIWALGTAVLALPILISLFGLWRMGRRLPQITDDGWQRLARELSAALRLSHPVTLLRGRPRAMPMTWGVLHPKLVLPPEAEDWCIQRRRVVLMHELAHIKRGDFVVQFIVQLARAIYWFNPLMWVASRQIALESEGACDDLVLASETLPSDYAEHLLAIATGLKEGFLLNTAAVAMARSSRLQARIIGILDGTRNRTRLTIARVAVLGMMLTALILPVAAMRAAARPPAAVTAQGATAVVEANGQQFITSRAEFAGSADQHHEVLKARLEKARAVDAATAKRFEAGLIDQVELQKSKNAVEMLEAELSGDPRKLAEARLTCTRRMLELMTARVNAGFVNPAELAAAKGDVVVAEAQLRQAAAGADAGKVQGGPVKADELTGTVTDEAGNPLAGVLLHVWSWCPGIQTRTDEHGRYTLKKLGSQPIEIRVGKDGFDPWYSATQPVGVELNIKLSSRTYFEGLVIGPDGKPLADAQVRAYSTSKRTADNLDVNLWIDAVSDAKGRYRLLAMPDTYTVTIRVPNVGSVTLPGLAIADGQAQPLDIHLTPGVAFRAQIVDGETGAPVANVKLGNWRSPSIEGTSDKDGNLLIPTMDPGKFEFNISAEGYARWWSAQATEDDQRKETREGFHRNFDYLDFDITPDMKPVRIELERHVRITGVIQDPDGNPVAGATAAPAHTGTGNSLTGDTRYSVVTKADGTFIMTLPASGNAKYNLEAHDGQYGQWRKWANGVNDPIQTKPGDAINNVVIKLTRPISVSGTVKDETGKPIAGRDVRASAADRMENRYYDPTTKTDMNGKFTLKFVRPGDHFIQAAPFWSAEESSGKNNVRVTLNEGQPALAGIELITTTSTGFPTVEEQIRRAIENSNRKENAHPDLTNLKGAWKVRSLQGMPVFQWMQAAVGDVIHIDNVSTVPVPPKDPALHDYYTITPSGDPKEMDVTYWVENLWQTSRGIYRLDGDTLTICMAPYNEKNRPTEFKPGTGTLVELVRVQPGEPKAAVPSLNYGLVTDGVQLALQIDTEKGAIPFGRPIKARFHFRNAGPIPITLRNPTLWQPSSDEFIVTDSQGNKLQTYSTWFTGWDVGREDALAAGQSVGVATNAIAFYPEPFDGAKVQHPVGSYAFLKPGKYTVQYKLRAPMLGANPPAWQGELASAPVAIEVVAALPAPATAPASGLPAKAAAATSIVMTVTDASTNKPIRDAKISIWYDYQGKSFKTDANGQATLEIDAGHRLRFLATVSASDHVAQSVKWSAPEPADGQAAMPLVASVSLQPSHTLGGTVVDVDGNPVAEAGVMFQSDDPHIAYVSSVTTDKAGHWAANVFPIDSSKITFTVVHRAYAPFKSEPLPIDQTLRNQTTKFAMHFPLEFALTVTDAQTGQRLVDTKSFRIVPLTTPQLDNGPFNVNDSSHTLNHGSGHGDFTLTFQSRVTQGALRIEADGYESVNSPQITRDKDRKPVAFNAMLKRLTLPASQPAQPQTQPTTKAAVNLPKYVDFSGTVVDDATGKPVPNFSVQGGLIDEKDPAKIKWGYTLQYTTSPNPTGRFSSRVDWAGGWRSRIVADGYIGEPIMLKLPYDAKEFEGMVIRLKRGRRVSGHLLDHTGKPVADAGVFVVGNPSVNLTGGKAMVLEGGMHDDKKAARVATDANGGFTVTGIAEDRHHIAVTCPAMDLWVVEIPKEGGNIDDLTIRLPEPGKLVVHYDIPGAPEKADIFLQYHTWDLFKDAGVSNQHYAPIVQHEELVLNNLAPGTYVIDRTKNPGIAYKEARTLLDRREITIESRKTTTIDFVRPTGAPITGQIVGLDQGEVAKAHPTRVVVRVVPVKEDQWRSVVFDDITMEPGGKPIQGDFVTEQMVPDQYKVRVEIFVPEKDEQIFNTGIVPPAFVAEVMVSVPETGKPEPIKISLKPWDNADGI